MTHVAGLHLPSSFHSFRVLFMMVLGLSTTQRFTYKFARNDLQFSSV